MRRTKTGQRMRQWRFGGENGSDVKAPFMPLPLPVPMFREAPIETQCPANFTYVAVILQRDELGMTPTKLVYGKMYPPIGIDVSEGKCAVLVGKKIAQRISEGTSGFVEVDPEDIIVLSAQKQLSDRDIGTIINRAPPPIAAGATRQRREKKP